MIRTLTFELPMEEGPGTHGAPEYLQIMVELWPDDSATIAVKHPTPTSDGVWSRKYDPVRDESSEDHLSVAVLSAQQVLQAQDIEERRAGA